MSSVFVVSDGTGMLAEQTLRAAMTQFSNVETNIIIRGEIRNEQHILTVIHEAAQQNGLIVHTLVSRELRTLITRMGKLQNVETIDLLGPLLQQLSEKFSNMPSEKPGLFHRLDDTYFRRIETMEFAFRHDDGQRAEELDRAEIVLVGVSRTFKTPLSIYLAFKGWFVANVPIVLDIDPPDSLFSVPKGRVIALVTNYIHLAELRKAREKYLKQSTGHYADLNHVKRELQYAKNIYSRQPNWQKVIVTNKPIEEIASEIMSLIQVKKT